MKPLLALGALAMAVTACGGAATSSSSSSSSNNAPTEDVSLCMPADTTGAVADIAVNRNTFAPYHVNVSSLKLFSAGGDALNAVAAGQCDMANTSELPGLTLASQGGKVYLLAEGETTKTNIGLVGKSSITSAHDLVGKKVAFVPASVGQLYFQSYVNHYHISSGQVQQVNITAPDTLTVLQRGDADAVFIWQPFLGNAATQVPGMHIIAHSGDDNVLVVTSYYYIGARLQNDPQLTARVLKGLIDAETWFNSHPAAGYAIVGQYIHETDSVVQSQASAFKYDITYTPATVTKVENANKLLAQIKPSSQGGVNLATFLQPQGLRVAAPQRCVNC